MKFMATFAALLFSASTVLAASMDITVRTVWNPEFIEPKATSVWQVGKPNYVVWSLDQKPKDVTDSFGMVYLVKNGMLGLGA